MKAAEPDRRRPERGFIIACTLFASYLLAANAAVALHELGHALGVWVAGGKVLGFYLAPQGYAGAYAARDFSVPFATNHGRFLQVAGGPAFGAACGLVLLLAARRFGRGTVGWIATHSTAAWCLGNNGAYLAAGSLYPFGDVLVLTELGVPRWSMFLAGLPLVVAFLATFASFLRGIGLKAEDSYWRWVVTVEAGLLTYLAVIAAARWLWPLDWQVPPTGNDLIGLAASPAMLLLLATCSYALRRIGSRPEPPTVEPRWSKAGLVLALGLLLVAVEVVLFSYDYEGAAARATQRFGCYQPALALR